MWTTCSVPYGRQDQPYGEDWRDWRFLKSCGNTRQSRCRARARRQLDDRDEGRDFFISYTHVDLIWAEWLAWELDVAGYTTSLQVWDMAPGSSFAHVMDREVRTARHVLLVLSPAYLRSAMTEAEWRPGFVADPSGERRALVPVRVEECSPQGLLADRVWIDLVGLDEATARAKLRREIAAAVRGHDRPTTSPHFPRRVTPPGVHRPRFPNSLPSVWNVPFVRNQSFTGRDNTLADLSYQFSRRGAAAVTQVLQGGGGVGKTALAVEYAYRHRSEFDAVWWVRGEQPATLVGDYAELAAALSLKEADQANQELVASAVRRWLEDHDRWLLILDNAEGPQSTTGLRAALARLIDLVPRVINGQVLITSRDASWHQHATLVELDVFTPEEAAAFLLARSASLDQTAAAQIAMLLGWLPLALEQAAAYVRDTRMGLAAYLERLRQFPTMTLRKGRPRDRDPTVTVASTWQVSLEKVESTPGAVDIVEVCALLGPESIPRELLRTRIDPPITKLGVLADEPFGLDDAIAALHRFGLVKATEHSLTVHRLLQQVVRDHFDPATASSRTAMAVRLLANAFPNNGYEDPHVWPACEELLSHALAAAGHAEQHQVEPAATSDLLDRAECYLHGRARYAEARVLAERALTLAEIAFGAEHAVVGNRLRDLAIILLDQGDLDAARTLLERAVEICETRLGPHHVDTACCLNVLAGVLRAQGDLETARRLLQRALDTLGTRLGDNHPHTIQCLNSLASVLLGQGDLVTARSLHQQALTNSEVYLGPDSLHTAWSLNYLASVCREEGDLTTARAFYQRALRIFEGCLGRDHPHTAVNLSNLGAVLCDLGDPEAARSLLERALAIRVTSLGVDHPAAAGTRAVLAGVIKALESKR